MNASVRPSSLKLAASREALSPQLATLLALQRAEEPETPTVLIEVPADDIFQGLMCGRYDLGITWATSTELPLDRITLWQDELAVAMPPRSPLLAHQTISPEHLEHQRLFCCCPSGCEALKLRADEVQLGLHPAGHTEITSFPLMAVFVAAGYGIGIALRSRIAQARSQGIVLRPLAGEPRKVSLGLFRPRHNTAPETERFAMRAQRVAAPDPHSTPPLHAQHDKPPGSRRAESPPLPPR
ncbi:TPA: LysR substrate-binding domain-containing protein [Stenotrophomonas maltophilia]|uniref:LysR substrate-binding domain-containing protein n=1 Tax=Burkholderia sp. LMG 13014 TaxID=2709306 RepID=UPI001962CC97|nr:transcriptional regulator [Stenotrophomonas maltophilia]HEJ3240009.1 LysR family transcriptional regulator [Pseudomonas aeruginosa]HDS1372554.1 transcriptional regulator [Stenotrophomonas maltophilia]HDS1376479.1 transcriptional regulator [Stenotrophomonas maltophilia]HDS1381333.1 transcriptional regulator [Stenotrophomonas maltophilia]